MKQAAARPMSRAELRALLGRLGSDRRQWPDDDATRAARLIETDRRAQRHWQQARDLDALLDAATVGDADPDLARRIAAQISTRPRSGAGPLSALFGTRPLWQRAMLAALPVLLGFVLGLALAPTFDDQARADAAAELASISRYGLLPTAPPR